VDDPVVSVSVDEPPVETDAGLNAAVVPEGKPLADSDTVWADPAVSEVETLVVPLDPCVRLKLLGLAASEKSSVGGAVTVTFTVVVCVADEPVPVTVTG
jgi:hypothetical protein